MKTSTLVMLGLGIVAVVAVTSKKASASPAPRGPVATTWVVKPGDSLSSIAKELTGMTEKWRELYAINMRAVGPNPDALQVGRVLILPQSWLQQPLFQSAVIRTPLT